MNSIKQLAGQTIIYGMGTIVPRVLNYALLTPFYTRVLGLGEYGVVTEIYAYMAILLILLTYGMETAYFRFATKDKNNKGVIFSSALTSLLITSVSFIIIVLAFSTNFATLLQYSGNREYIIMFSLIVGIDAVSALPFARLRIENRVFKFATIKIINVLVIVGVAISFLLFIPEYLKNKPGSVLNNIYSEEIGVGYVFIANLCGSVVSLILLIPDFVRDKYSFSVSILKKMLNYSIPLLFAGLAGIIIDNFDKASLKFLLPGKDTAIEQLGIYGANYKIAVLMAIFIQMFRYAAEPFFFSKANDSRAPKLYAGIMNYFLLFCLLIFLFININLDIFKHLIPYNYWDGLNVIPVLLGAFVMFGIFVNLSVWYKLNDITKYAALLASIGAIITIMVNVIFVPHYGYKASAWAHLLSYLIMTVVSYYLGRKIYKVPYMVKKALIYIFVSLVIFLSFSNWVFSSMLIKLITGNIILIVFTVFIYFREVKNKLGEFEK